MSKNLYANNHFEIKIPGLVTPDFQEMDGLEKSMGEISKVSGDTNIKYKFSSGIKDYGEITLTRPYDGSVDDALILALEKFSFDDGNRVDATLVKYHNKQEVFRILLFGLMLKKVTYPGMGTANEDRFDMKYTFSVSSHEEVRV